MSIDSPVWCAHAPGLAMAAAIALQASQVLAHPHVFVDGGVDFVFREGTVLEALDITWLYDEFETLYILSSHGLSLNDEGILDESDRKELVRDRSEWPEDFDGSAHLAIDGHGVELEWPANLDAQLVDGRLEITFTRRLRTPMPVRQRPVELAFYESTYFFAFSVTNEPRLIGEVGTCTANVVPFNPNDQTAALQATLLSLSREESPETENVGALLADRITLRCG